MVLWETDIIWQFLNKNAQFEKIYFYQKKIPNLYLVIICNRETLARLEYKGKLYVKNIRKCRIRNRIRIRILNQLKSGIWIQTRIRKQSFLTQLHHNWGTHGNLQRSGAQDAGPLVLGHVRRGDSLPHLLLPLAWPVRWKHLRGSNNRGATYTEPPVNNFLILCIFNRTKKQY